MDLNNYLLYDKVTGKLTYIDKTLSGKTPKSKEITKTVYVPSISKSISKHVAIFIMMDGKEPDCVIRFKDKDRSNTSWDNMYKDVNTNKAITTPKTLTNIINDVLHIKCNTCGTFKKACTSNFQKRPETANGFRSVCNTCHTARRTELRHSKKGKVKNKDYRLKFSYGITTDEYNQLRCKQNYKCAICQIHEQDLDDKTNVGGVKGFVVDHNHNTSEVRGLLCNRCNVALGFFKDDTKILSQAMIYLTQKGSYGSD